MKQQQHPFTIPYSKKSLNFELRYLRFAMAEAVVVTVTKGELSVLYVSFFIACEERRRWANHWNSSCRCESDRCCRVGGFRVQRGVQRGNWDWCFLRSYVIGQLDCGARCSTPPGCAWIGRL
ncbi:hypothetical protein T07_1262 [Trichinella nelsoni]|uniref:Uncharacterized protein n=1 Tax=Trichinella nelsoni TaxID=6336 RepID=A0A0V0RWZ1_9BILA|nr:hypothetical protein T07_1262 [Trichinella nelsoni]